MNFQEGNGEKKVDTPKKPMSAYCLFIMKNRDGVKRENPTMNLMDTVKVWCVMAFVQELAHRWQGLGETEKQEYLLQAEEEKKKYTQAMKNTDHNTYELQLVFSKFKFFSPNEIVINIVLSVPEKLAYPNVSPQF